MSDPGCGNPCHPAGAWHPATPLPPTWHPLQRFRYAMNRRRWGCGCDATLNDLFTHASYEETLTSPPGTIGRRYRASAREVQRRSRQLRRRTAVPRLAWRLRRSLRRDGAA